MRLLKGAGALLALAALVVGIPWLLITMVGNPLPGDVSPAALWRTLLTPDDGTVLIDLVAIIAWVAWVVFTLAVATESVAAASRQRIRIRLPGLAGPQRLAGTLVLLVIAGFSPPQLATAEPAPTPPAVAPSSAPADRADTGPGQAGSRSGPVPRGDAGPEPDSRPDDRGEQPTAGTDRTVRHRVEPGDDLWTLAERYYGSGTGWRRIAAANPDRLTGGPDRLEPGWQLRIPGVDAGDRQLRVGAGDTLSSIAEREYGDGTAWPRIFHANRGTITDPDLIPIGVLVTIPPAADDQAAAAGSRAGDQDAADSAAADEPADGDAQHTGDAAGSDTADPSTTDGSTTDGQPGAAPRGSAHPSPGRETGAVPAGQPDRAGPDRAGPDRAGTDRPGARTVSSESNGVGDLAFPTSVAAGIGGVLAASLIAGLAARRHLQLHLRGLGRRIPQPPAPAQLLQTRLGRRQDRLGLQHLDLALRAIGRDCVTADRPLPTVVAARLHADGLTLIMAEDDHPAPDDFTVTGAEWQLARADADRLTTDTELPDAAQPYPALTSVGIAPDGDVLVINLETAAILSIGATGTPTTSTAISVARAMASELTFSPWSDDLVISLIGDRSGLATAVDRYNVSDAGDLDQLLQRWEQRARLQRDHLGNEADGIGGGPGRRRLTPDLADPWMPEIAVIMEPVSHAQAGRLEQILQAGPPVSMAAVLAGGVAGSEESGHWRLQLSEHDAHPTVLGPETGATPDDTEAAAPGWTARLHPLGWRFAPQLLDDEDSRLIRDLIACTGTDDTEPAPWWAADFPDGEHGPARAHPAGSRPPPNESDDDRAGAPARHRWPHQTVHAPDPDAERRTEKPDAERHTEKPDAERHTTHNVTAIDTARSARTDASEMQRARRGASEESVTVSSPTATPAPGTPPSTRSAAVDQEPVRVPTAPRHPTLKLLGPIDLVGAGGRAPSRAVGQCIEYCTWLLEHPGRTAQTMAAALVVAEGTRRSNMSRLRSWLGTDDQGEPYLPDAYSGRIVLSPLVSSDWHRLQILTATGVNRAGTEGLCRALELVRGAPLADTAPAQWHWAEEMRTDMVSVIRDIGVELTDRALADSDIDLARWAAARSLTAAPQDELLIGARIRTEHLAGNAAEVERLALQLTANARALGLDLNPDTVDLLQQVMEGGLRARA